MATVYVGLDLGSRTCHQVGVDKELSVLLDRKFDTSERNLIQAFKQIEGKVHVHLETCELAAWARRVLRKDVEKVVVGHAKTNKWIGNDPHKNDRIDAKKLAELLAMGKVHEVYYPDDEDRVVFKQVVQQYDDFTRQQVALKLKIKSRFRQQGVIAVGKSVYGKKTREASLKRVPSEEAKASIQLLYAVHDRTLESQRSVLKLIGKMAKRYPEMELLDSVPGVGLVGASCFFAYVQDPHRFSSKRALWRYCGLGVTDQMSDGRQVKHRRLDRWSGNPRLKAMSRTAFIGAMRSTKENAFQRAFKASVERLHNETHARLNVQRKIVSVLRAVWKGGTPYKDDMGEVR